MNPIGLLAFIERHTLILFRVPIQTVFTPLITAVLYIFVFGKIVGERIGDIMGVPYIDFVLPGLVMMNVVMSSFTDTSSGTYFFRFTRSIEELLTAPFSYGEIIIGIVTRGVVRGLLVGTGVYVLALFFTSASIAHLGFFFLYALAVSIIFSLVGVLVGIFSDHFEHLTILNTFLIVPLTFLGGVFNSVSMLPPALQTIVSVNPFFYFVDGIRFAMLGFHESNLAVGALIIVFLTLSSGFLVWYFFKTGYRIRE